MTKAKIKDVRVCSVYDLWKRKPRGLGFEDTDAVIVRAETDKGEQISETFYVCLKPDGTINTNALSRRSRARRARFARFLRGYGITDALKGYKIPEGVKEWKGKEVEITTSGKMGKRIVIH